MFQFSAFPSRQETGASNIASLYFFLIIIIIIRVSYLYISLIKIKYVQKKRKTKRFHPRSNAPEKPEKSKKYSIIIDSNFRLFLVLVCLGFELLMALIWQYKMFDNLMKARTNALQKMLLAFGTLMRHFSKFMVRMISV